MQAVIFDCDGTLVDSEPLAGRAWEQALAPYGYTVTGEDLSACLGRPYPVVHAFFAERAEIPAADELWPGLSARLFALIDAELAVFPDVPGTLDGLAAAGVPLAVASSSPRERLDRTLARAGLAHRLPVSVAGDEVAHGKPAPDMLLAAATRLGAPAEACVVVEDSAPGVEAARAAGMVAVGIARRPGERLAVAGADVVLSALSAAGLARAARRARPEAA